MKKVIFYSIICTGIAFSLSMTSLAQKPDTAKLKNEKALNASQVKAKFDELKSSKAEVGLRRLRTSMEGKGFKAEEGYFGTEATIENGGTTLTNTVIIQDYKKGNKGGALGVVTISDGKNKESYTFSLETTGNSYTDVSENFINDKDEVEKAHSWYSCLYKSMQAKCGSVTGLQILNSCWNAYAGASWSSFLSCIKGAWCGVSSLACCTCDCSWWCKYVAGCCDR